MAFANLGKDRVRSLPLNQIMVNPAQPRTHFEEEALQQLAQSIAASGLLQPVIVRSGLYAAGIHPRSRYCQKLHHAGIGGIGAN